ncbi:hypothetical protein BDZ88DRAFT_420927 [Geranomyces variabilis]|nr:hypothetical protein BDZ88DRAFT_420927 [Geranomyces variabilis]
MPGGAGDVKPAAPLSSASPAKPTESMLSLVASPLPSGVKPGGAGPPAPVASSSSSVPASVKKVTLRDIRDIPQVPGLLNDFTTRPRTLTFERDTFRPVFGQYHEPEDDGQPLRLGVTPEAAGNEFRRYGQDRAVDHWTAPFELPIETFDESWEEIEKRVPTTLLNALDRKIGRGWVDELLFILGRPAVAW